MSFLPARMGLIKSKMKELECSQDFSHYKYGDFSRRSRAAYSAILGPIWPNFLLVRDVMDVLNTCQYEEDPIKNRGARVFTRLCINFSDAQGQITLEVVLVSGPNLNSSKLSCMSSLPARKYVSSPFYIKSHSRCILLGNRITRTLSYVLCVCEIYP